MPRKQSIVGTGTAFGERSWSRRDFLKLGGTGLAGVVLLGVSACGGGNEDSADLVFAHWPDPGRMQPLLKRFHKQGNVRVRPWELPPDFGETLEKLETEFQVRGGRIDVTTADSIWTAQLAANGWIADVSNRFPESERSRFLDGSVQSLVYGGGIYGAPWGTTAGMLYYRKDLLEQSGFSEAPGTWAELKEMAEKTVRESGTKYGFVFQGGNYEGGVCNGLEFIWTHGGNVVAPDAPDKVVIDSPQTVAGLATEQSMVSSGVAPHAVANYSEAEAETTFLAGDAVFCRNWDYMYALPGDPDHRGRLGIKPEQVGVSALPVGDGQRQTASCHGGINLLINASSGRQDEIWDFVRFLTDEESQKLLIPDNTPTLKSLYEDRQVLEAMPVLSAGKEVLQNARLRPVSPHYSEMSRMMAEQFNGVLRSTISPEEAVETLQGGLKQIIEQGQ